MNTIVNSLIQDCTKYDQIMNILQLAPFHRREITFSYLNVAKVDVGVQDFAMNAVDATLTGIVALPAAVAMVAGTATNVCMAGPDPDTCGS